MGELFSHFPLSLSFLTIEDTTKQGGAMKKVAQICVTDKIVWIYSPGSSF